MKKASLCCCSGVVSLFLLATSAWTQDYRGRVEGLVSDPSQAVIAGATVTLLNVNTGVRAMRQTSPTGLYLFDLLDPGYLLVDDRSRRASAKFVQQNIVVQTRGDVTVNATLNPGTVQESITVNETPVDVQFNSSNKDLTIDSKMATEIPRFDRNPFKLTLIAPSAVNTRGEMMPYHSWSANSVDLGGGTNLKNDLQVDGMPVGMGQKNSTPPNTDAVQEVDRFHQQRGRGIGPQRRRRHHHDHQSRHQRIPRHGLLPGPLSVAERRGRPHHQQPQCQRQHMFGGTLGNPIKKNKLFNFASVEYWKVGYPNSYVSTVPTAAERGRRFLADPQHRWQPADHLRSVFHQARPGHGRGHAHAVPRQHHSRSRFDPLAASLMKQFWAPQQSRRQYHRCQQLQEGLHRELRLLQLLRPRGLQHQR